MPTIQEQYAQASVTPNRVTTVLLDTPQTHLIVPKYGVTRRGGEVCRAGAHGQIDDSNAYNVQFHPSLQCWTLKTIQSDISNLHERVDTRRLIQALELFFAVLYRIATAGSGAKSGLAEEPIYHRPEELAGIGEGVLQKQVSGDMFMAKKVAPPPERWDVKLNTDWQLPQIDPIPNDRILESREAYRANQAFFLRWTVPGTVQNSPQTIWRFYFGQYAISVGGDGKIRLYEGYNINGQNDWRLRLTFRYCEPSRVCNVAHTLAIWPTADAWGRRFLVFANNSGDAAETTLAMERNDYQAFPLAEAVYAIDSGIRGNDPDQSPGLATRSDTIRVDVRRDIRTKFQISTLGYETRGTLVDAPFNSLYLTSSRPLLSQIFKYEPGNAYGISLALKNLFTNGGPLVTDDWNSPYGTFTFSGDGLDTPVLFGYELFREPETATVAPGAFSTGGYRKISLMGYDGDPAAESGSLSISDTGGVLTRLQKRGEFPILIKVTYTPPQSLIPVEVPIFSGYAIRPDEEIKGKAGWQAGQTEQNEYPSRNWRDYDLALVGEYYRLAVRTEQTFKRTYAQDFDAPDIPGKSVKPPWKVTSVIRDLLYAAGYGPDQVNIPDLSFRLWPSAYGLKEQDVYLAPHAFYAEELVRLARNYLGLGIFFNEASGLRGRWELLFAPANTSLPIAHFRTTGEIANFPPHLPGAFTTPNTYPVLSKIRERTIPPEYNYVRVRCPVPLSGGGNGVAVENDLHNPYSYNRPGFAQIATPEHPDFLGYEKAVLISEPSLRGLGTASDSQVTQETQRAVNWTMLRIYDFVAHGKALRTFLAPLAFVFDAEIGTYRKLRKYDVVTLNGKSMEINDVNIAFTHDVMQVANYTLIEAYPKL